MPLDSLKTEKLIVEPLKLAPVMLEPFTVKFKAFPVFRLNRNTFPSPERIISELFFTKTTEALGVSIVPPTYSLEKLSSLMDIKRVLFSSEIRQ